MESGASHPLKETVFCPVRASYWPNMEDAYREALSDPSRAVRVVALPWFEKAADGTLLSMHYEGELLPDDLPVIHYDAYDFETSRPDTIVIDHPYDAYHDTMSVHPHFYAERLKACTDHLVYLPYMTLSEPDPADERGRQTFLYFVAVPGVICADETYVQSESMRQAYIDYLAQYAGEETRERWERQIRVRKKKEKAISQTAEDTETDRRKKILFTITLSTLLEYGSAAADKLKSVVDIACAHKERVTFVWRSDPMIEAHKGALEETLYLSYRKEQERLLREACGILADDTDCAEVAKQCDAFYGDPCEAMRDCIACAKPVMQMDVDVC